MQGINWEKVGVYLAIVTTVLLFWQSWRDLTKDNTELRERTARLEVEVSHLKNPEPLRYVFPPSIG